jgi:hypothetical protein
MKVNIGCYPDDDSGRIIDVQIDEHDIWNADHTLACIIVPVLQKIKDAKQGAPCVEEEDVPEDLRDNAEEKAKYLTEGETSSKFHPRWYWVLDEMIWTFTEIRDSTEHDRIWVTLAVSEALKENDKLDARLQNGLRLFGKYYRSLWT